MSALERRSCATRWAAYEGDTSMRKRLWMIVGALFVLLLISVATSPEAGDLLLVAGVIVALWLLSGVVPFVVGFSIQLLIGSSSLPNWVLWAGAALLALPAVVWHQPDVVLFGSRWVGVAALFILNAMFLDYGTRLARWLRERRARRGSTGDGQIEA
jgi:hypothetical protein